MTREDAIEILKNSAWLGTDEHREETEKAVEMAISALEQEPCRYWKNGKCNGNTEVCEDAISRKSVLSVIDGWYEQKELNIEDLIILITYMSSVTPNRRKGKGELYEGEFREESEG